MGEAKLFLIYELLDDGYIVFDFMDIQSFSISNVGEAIRIYLYNGNGFHVKNQPPKRVLGRDFPLEWLRLIEEEPKKWAKPKTS